MSTEENTTAWELFKNEVRPEIEKSFGVEIVDDDENIIYIRLIDRQHGRKSDIIDIWKNDLLNSMTDENAVFLADKIMGDAMWKDISSDMPLSFAENINPIYPETPDITGDDPEGSNLNRMLKRKKRRFYNEPYGYGEQMNEGLQEQRNKFKGQGTENSYGGPYGGGRPLGW